MRGVFEVPGTARSLPAVVGADPGASTSSTGRSEPTLADDAEPEGRPRVGAPFFIVGFQRSGTSLLRAMLDEHPKLAVSTDSEFIPSFWDNRDRYMTGDHVDARLLVSDAMATPRVAEWDLPEDVISARLAMVEERTFADAVRVVFEAYADARGKPRWGDKTPRYVGRIPLLASLFPDVRFVHVIRDGRDAAISCLSHGLLADNVVRLAELWVERVGAGRSAGRAIGPQRYLEVRYEDLAAEPARALASVCDFLDLEFDPGMLRYTERALSELPTRVRYRHENLAKPPTPGLRDWREEMAPSDIAAFQAVGGRLLDELGYEPGIARIPFSSRLRTWRRVARRWVRKARRR